MNGQGQININGGPTVNGSLGFPSVSLARIVDARADK
jgi:hypothetical protein